jgi:hypothetical protein
MVLGDTKGEHSPVVQALGGQVVRIGRGAGSLNVLDAGAMDDAARRVGGTTGQAPARGGPRAAARPAPRPDRGRARFADAGRGGHRPVRGAAPARRPVEAPQDRPRARRPRARAGGGAGPGPPGHPRPRRRRPLPHGRRPAATLAAGPAGRGARVDVRPADQRTDPPGRPRGLPGHQRDSQREEAAAVAQRSGVLALLRGALLDLLATGEVERTTAAVYHQLGVAAAAPP